jgi:hypothetical protein
MPIIDGKTVSPDHAIHQGLCPECGARLDHKTALPHAQGHWGMDPDAPRLSEEGRRRFNLVLDFIEIAKPKLHLEGEGKIRDLGTQSMANSSLPNTPPSPTHDTPPFWIDQWIAGGIFAAGLTMLPDHFAFGCVLSVIGLVWLVYLRMGQRSLSPQVRTPNIIAIVLLVCAVGVMGYDIYDRQNRPAIVPPTAAQTISGTADTTGGAIDVGVKIDMDMPYEVFCTTNWGSPCYAKEKKDRLIILAFNVPAPPSGGKVEWHATPTPLLKAYHDEVNTVAERDKSIADQQAQTVKQDSLRNLSMDFLRLPRPCTMKITAPPENLDRRSQVAGAASDASVQF